MLLIISCASLLLSGGTPSHAQTVNSIDYLYVSPSGSDSWSGQFPTAQSPAGEGPFETLSRAQESVNALTDSGLARPVEIVFDAGVCSAPDFLSRWFTEMPDGPVIWHCEPNRTILIYTRTEAEQAEALSAEDGMNAPGIAPVRFYVSPSGSDAWSGQSPAAEGDTGPFQSLSRAEEAVLAVQTQSPDAPVELIIESGLSGAPGQLKAAGGKPSPKSAKHLSAAAKSALKASAGSKTPPARAASALAQERAYAAKITPVGTGTPASRLVFAHYVMSAADYTNNPGGVGTAAGYAHDIQDAQAAGVDGFVLNCGAWNAANYKIDTAYMFQAAHQLNSGFKLFFSVDEGGGSVSPAEIQNMIQTYANNPSYFHYQGRPVLSTWGGDGSGPAAARNFWQNSVLTPLRSAGYNIYFVPQFTADSYQNITNGLMTTSKAQAYYQLWWKSLVDGLFQVSTAPPMTYAYSRTSPAVSPPAGQQGGLTLWDMNWDHFYDPTNEFSADDVGRTITITPNADFAGGTYVISHFDGGYPVTDASGKSLGSHNLVTLILPGNSPAKHFDATGGGYSVQSRSAAPKESPTLVAEETYAQTMHANGKLFISGVTPQYWGSLRTDVGRCYSEFCGGEGLAAQWNSVINVQKPQWVELFTWNDFAEDTYFSPIDDVAKYFPYTLPGTNNNVPGYMTSHAGFTALNKYFINWYKSGVQPAITGDNIYYFYRTQPMNMVATNDPLGPVTNFAGPVADVIYITSMLPTAATLQVTSGGTSQTFSLSAGSSTLRVPFSPGPQTFTLLRNGQTVLTQQGAPVVSSAPTYNFGLYSGSMSD